ncbi:DUF6207 family protein [Streptomyces avermitilis]
MSSRYCSCGHSARRSRNRGVEQDMRQIRGAQIAIAEPGLVVVDIAAADDQAPKCAS